jgi:hypothetical protein
MHLMALYSCTCTLYYTELYVYVQVKLHMTDASRADEFITKHIGSKLLFPPFSADRLEVRQSTTLTLYVVMYNVTLVL